MSTYTPGFGDIATWPGLSGHPHDPRTPEPQTLDDWTGADMLEAIRIAEDYLGRAERAIRDGDLAAARDHMRCAAGELRGE